MEPEQVVLKLSIALGLGLLVGLQRERVRARLAGIRTIALVTLGGAVFTLVGLSVGGWVVAAGAAGVVALLVVGNLQSGEEDEPGLTTEVAVLLMYGVGALVVVGPLSAAVAVGGCTAVLLHWKEPLHRFVAGLGEVELKGVMQFVLVACVMWPVLPDRPIDPRGVINPTEVWFVVVLLVGINLCGFVTARVIGGRANDVVSGLLGGLVSSTATTVAFARRPHDGKEGVAAIRTVLVIASAVAVARMLAEVAVVAPTMFLALSPRLGVLCGVMVVLAAGVALLGGRSSTAPVDPDNPTHLKTAVLFGLLYVGAKWAVAMTGEYLGHGGLYAVAGVAGLHDVDAITLSTSSLVAQGQLDADVGSRLMVTAALSNLVWKAVLAGVFGGRRVLAAIGWPFGVAVVAGLVVLLW